jgi:predicted nucleotidyltransferase component of viral defense system
VILFGGTALALQIGHRMSYDFDFFSPQHNLRDEFLNELRAVLPELKVTQWEENTLSVQWNEVQISFFSNITLKIINPFLNYQHLRMLDKPDIIAMKIAAMLRRATIRDYFDIAYLLEFEGISLSEMIRWFYEKYAHQADQFTRSLIIKTLSYVDDVPDEDLRILSHQEFWNTKESLKSTIAGVLVQKSKDLIEGK